MRELSNGYTAPAGACLTFSLFIMFSKNSSAIFITMSIWKITFFFHALLR